MRPSNKPNSREPRTDLWSHDPQPVVWPALGNIGTLTAEADPDGRRRWRARTPSGTPAPHLGTQEYAVMWLRRQADPDLALEPKPHIPAPDPVLAMIERHLRDGDRGRADAAVLACIAKEIDDMRKARMSKNPPALWHHLEQIATWLAALNGAARPGAARPGRVLELVATTRRTTT